MLFQIAENQDFLDAFLKIFAIKLQRKFVNDFDFNSMLYYYLQQYLKEDEIPPDSACKHDSISHQSSHSKVIPIQQMPFLASQQANVFKSMNSTLDSDRIPQSAP